MQRELSSFPMPPVHRMKLQTAGFTTVDDLTGMKPTELGKELNIPKEEALDILKVVFPTDANGQPKKAVLASRRFTALDMLKDELSQQCIITFSQELDALLGGGVPLTKITEICGAPGVGKTQMCMQLVVDVQIPECFGGVGGEAVFIDTEGSFIVDRLVDIAQAAHKHCHQMAQADQNPDQLTVMTTFTVNSILSRVFYFRCHDYTELIALVHVLPDFLKEHPKVRLVVVDSIAFHFRHDFDDLSQRTRLLNGLAQTFIKMATEHKLAVVLTNQMTTRVTMEAGKQSNLVPALGESWGHASTVRLILYWERSQRQALLYKSPSQREATVPYQITTGGIRDVQTAAETRDKPQSSNQPSKRPRLDS